MKSERNNLFNASQSWRHLLTVCCALFYLIEKVRQRALWTNNGKETDKSNNTSTIDAAPGTARVPNCREETIQFNVLGFWCNHMVLELLQAKILPKRARDHQKSQNFWGFGPPAALKPRGCTRNLGNWMVWILPDILVPLLFWGLRQ